MGRVSEPEPGDIATLIASLNARLDGDEAAAKERRGTFPSPGVEDNGAVWLHIKRGGNAVVVHYLQPAEGYGDMADLKAWASADQGWTQSRALREVEAKRKLITLALENAAETDGEWGDGHDSAEIAAGQCSDHGGRAALRNLAPLASIWGEP